MILLFALCAGLVAAAGAYLVSSRDVFRTALGLALLGSAAVLVIVASGGLASTAPPVVVEGERAPVGAANPVPQALALTAIVIGFALTCFSLVLVLRLVIGTGSDDALDLRHAEPVPVHPVDPPSLPCEVEGGEGAS